MIFNSVVFIYYFLPLVIGVFFLLRNHPRGQNLWLLAASFVFYGWCHVEYLLFLILFGLVNYVFARALFACGETGPRTKNWVLFGGVAANVAVLFFVKYLNFSIGVVNTFLHTGFSTVTNLIVPLGISFLVFSMIAYLADVYRRKIRPLEDPVDFFLYLSFFPKVSQGPITRCEQMQKELYSRSITLSDFCAGFRRFCFGLARKVLIADTLGSSVDLIFALVTEGLPPLAAWMGMLCYTFQIYFDFSAYSDMAIGLGGMLGFRLPENFDAPYLSRSVSEFWRRWHMTLGSWFREYVYIPLGGNRRGKIRTYCNLAVVWVLTGIWHGAAYTYILWGICLGAVIIFERMVANTRWYRAVPSIFKWLGTFVTIMFSWVLFRSNGLQNTIRYLLAMVGAEGYVSDIFGLQYFIDSGTLIALCAAVVLTIPMPKAWRQWMGSSDGGLLLQNIAALFFLMLALLFMINSTYNAFIYFQF